MLSRIILAAAVAAALSACSATAPVQPAGSAASNEVSGAAERALAHQIGIEGNQGELTSRARWDSARVVVRWARDVRHAIQLCAEAGPRIKVALAGCSWGTSDACNVVVVQPKDFYDIRALAVLGHEVWHCFGATHE